MAQIRALVFYLGVTLLTIPFSLLAFLLLPVNNVTRSRWVSGWAHLSIAWLRITCGIRVQVKGLEHLPKSPAIILAKHQSAWETIAFQTIFPPQIWVMKRSLLLIPFLGWAFMALRAIPIDRAAGREALKQLVSHGKDRLARGLWVVIFPEGTRISPGERGKYHIGGAWLATHTGAPVVPVAHNAGLCWPKNGFAKRSGVITVSIGPSIDPSGMKPDALNKQVEQWIEAEMQVLPPTT